MSDVFREYSNRADFMRQTGRHLYSEWTQAIINATVTPNFLEQFPAQLDNFARTYDSKPNMGVHRIDTVNAALWGEFVKSERQQDMAGQLLLPHFDDLIRFTSAQDVSRFGNLRPRNDSEKIECLSGHALDSLAFGLNSAVGYVYDNYAVRHHQISSSAEGFDVYKNGRAGILPAMHKLMGSLRDPSYDVSPKPKGQEDGSYFDRTDEMQKLAFIARSLHGNPSAISSLLVFSRTGFDVLREDSTQIDEGREGSDALRNTFTRMMHVGVAHNEPIAVMRYDQQSRSFSVLPEVKQFLNDARNRQNRVGLNEKERASTGPLADMRSPLTIGCPAAREIPLMAEMTGLVFQTVVDRHREDYGK